MFLNSPKTESRIKALFPFSENLSLFIWSKWSWLHVPRTQKQTEWKSQEAHQPYRALPVLKQHQGSLPLSHLWILSEGWETWDVDYLSIYDQAPVRCNKIKTHSLYYREWDWLLLNFFLGLVLFLKAIYIYWPAVPNFIKANPRFFLLFLFYVCVRYSCACLHVYEYVCKGYDCMWVCLNMEAEGWCWVSLCHLIHWVRISQELSIKPRAYPYGWTILWPALGITGGYQEDWIRVPFFTLVRQVF